VRQRKERRNPRHLGFGKQDHLCHGSTPLVPPVNQRFDETASKLMGPEPR
jgi:hypothetical protein